MNDTVLIMASFFQLLMTIAGSKRLVTARLCSRIKNPYIKKCTLPRAIPQSLYPDVQPALSVVIAELGHSDSPESSCNTGSIVNWWRTSPNNLAVKLRIPLWRMIVKPPWWQLRQCSIKKGVPQVHVIGSDKGCQPYHKHKASQKALFWRLKLWSLIGRAVSQEETPFSLAMLNSCCSWGERGKT